MTSRNTFRDGRNDTRDGGWITPISISPGDWKAIEDAVGKLPDPDRSAIVRICETCRHLAVMKNATMGEIKKTLEDISRLSDDDKIMTAVENCDESSRASIEEALYDFDGPNFLTLARRPAKVRAAAWLALQNLPMSAGGAPVKSWRIILAECVLNFCAERNLGVTASSLKGVSTPPVKLLMALIWIIDPGAPPEDGSVGAKLLRKVIA